jgi:hypothetical protein
MPSKGFGRSSVEAESKVNPRLMMLLWRGRKKRALPQVL